MNFHYLPNIAKDKIIEQYLGERARFLDIRLKSSFSPSAVAHASQELREIYFRITNTPIPAVTSSFFDPALNLHRK